ncbi:MULTISPECIES: phage terminase large subunit family protein [Pasteurellaceae]|uniref:Phage terminase large subunit family protein n=1 Tax=Pasteurella atlantica TaxID=2827233 RepID=A0AAW8CK05_9PAST|nr:phage terminase large subunit family protein [Pasteurella atlantica]MBR0574197.1 phage terminase large subunit family protein [Pasteurella atlantica]MDP8039306.1 phage terminase large subunit family protein [Pasteurella atlantica]MDP8041398.1 phage terminase large subunit family protein [Pasteurella atlantica]MDP8043534.1 phage terminase large subunit family protein [Pasteurella atlantica]MDP8045548.1 phage terminase large subunit family protein [Pasteurella atlantica]
MFASAKSIKRDIAESIKAPRRMKVSEAIAEYMRVPVGGGNSVKWDANTAPYMLEPINCLNSREYDAVIFVGPARTGKTLGLIDGWIVYSIVCDPSDMLLVQLTQEKASEHSRKRLDRTFRCSPKVAERLSPRKNDNNIHDKIFRGGNFLKIGWPSINILSSSDYKFVALTDYDRWPEDIDGEGDGFSLASKRTTTFMSSGMTLVESSPGKDIRDVKFKVSSTHEAPPTTGILSLYNRGDRRRLYWQCPHCSDYFQPSLENMANFREEKDFVKASENARLKCPHCKNLIEPEQKRQLNINSVWLKEGQKIDKQGKITGIARQSRIASFWMEGPAAAYQTWSQLTYKLLNAEHEYEITGSEEILKAVINTDWGLPYLPRAALEQRSSDELMERREELEKRIVPNQCRFLIAAVDVQGGKNRRFVVQIVGYGENGERWLIDRYNIKWSLRSNEDGECYRIDPSSYLEDWDLLTSDVLNKQYRLEGYSNRKMPILAMAVDSGGEDGVTDLAYKYWRKCKRNGNGKKVYLIKGDSTKRQKLITRSYPDNTGRSNRHADARGDVPLYLLQTDAFKDRIYNALNRKTEGANYIHFPDWLGEWFFDELVYEERGVDGKWRKPGKGNNEAFDLFCYAHAIAILRGYERIKWGDEELIPYWARLPNVNPNVIITETNNEQPAIELQKTQQITPLKPQQEAKSSGWIEPKRGGWL